VHFRPQLLSRLLHHKRAALRAARLSFAPKTLESASNFRPCESPQCAVPSYDHAGCAYRRTGLYDQRGYNLENSISALGIS
jgi:hypothetical protein